MNKSGDNKWTAWLGNKGKDFLWVCLLAIVLFTAAFWVFHKDEEKSSTAIQMSERESKVSRILQEIEGVGEASVIVCEDEDEVKSVVVVCEGANNLRVVMDVREAVAAALNTQQKFVKIYLKNKK